MLEIRAKKQKIDSWKIIAIVLIVKYFAQIFHKTLKRSIPTYLIIAENWIEHII